MHYDFIAIPEADVPRAADPLFQHLLDTYASETNKVITVWRGFRQEDLGFRPHPKSSTVADILRHQLLSERRFFAEFIGTPEPAPAEVLPKTQELSAYIRRMEELARPRLACLAAQSAAWWLQDVPFFEVTRQRIWVFWRRVLHTCHHRTQLAVYLRLLDRPVLSVYGPTADQSWEGADPTTSVEAAGRK
ncbi:MAG TPA: DinB family protein [Terriglobales bacterium]|nr:DinB family protein [Terriglobales bacterium]